jgi:hypothetical protein
MVKLDCRTWPPNGESHARRCTERLLRRSQNTLGLDRPVERSLWEVMGNDPIQGGERAPKTR